MKKNVLLVISFCLTTLLFCNVVAAQAPTGVFAKATVAPQIDGVVDDVWADATVYNIDKPLKTETPTLGASGETTWQALWTNEGVFILLKVADDAFYPNYAVTPAGNNWEYDKPEIYFDVNTVLLDAKGPATANSGHIQVAPGFPQGKTDGTKVTQSDGIAYAFLVTDQTYIAEYFIPFSKLKDNTGIEVRKAATIGFDVQIIDRDPLVTNKHRAVWANNVAAAGESYNNMDGCGTVTLQDGALFAYIDNITLNSGGTITTNGGTLQMVPTVAPENADNKTMKWSVINGTGIATISSTGLLTAIADGTVTVKAVATDGSSKEATTEVVISGQTVEVNDVWNGFNLIKNWNFDANLSSWGGWVDNGAASAGQVAPAVVDGVCVMKPVKATDNAAWHYQHNQINLGAASNVAYTLKFKSWASADNTPCVVDFEDSKNGNKRYGVSTDPGAVNGGSEWNYTVNTTPTWYTFHVTFNQIVANTEQKVQWMLSLSPNTIYLDSVLLVKDEVLPVFVNSISLNTEGTITTKAGTLQMVATVLPENATNKEVKWSVTPEGIATISSTGLLTAVADGTVTVKAESIDGTLKSATADVVVSGQVVAKELFKDFNLIQNWNFDTNLDKWGGWVDGGSASAGQVAPVVQDGVVVMEPVKATDNAAWHYQHSQSPLNAEANIGYTLKFKSWASADNTPCVVDFEDIPANSYKRYGTSADAEAVNGESEWHYNVNTTPQWFTFHVTFDKMVPTTVQKIQWMLSLSNETIYLDSVLLAKDSDMPVLVQNITLNSGAIDTKGGTLQMVATVTPEEAVNKTVKWSVTPEGIATISPDGLLTAVADGTVTVKAESTDGSLKSVTADVVISNQVSREELWASNYNLIQNWNFETNLDKWGGWVDGGVAGQVAPVVEDGVVVMKAGKATDNNSWHYQHSQSPLNAEANVGYTLKFKSWATADNTPCVVDFESGSSISSGNGGDQYNRYGATTDAESADGRSEWKYNVNTTPQWFTFHVTFDKIIPTTIQKLQYMLSLSNETIYLDSVLLVKDEYLNLPVESIALNTEGTITTNRGTLQMAASVAPVNAKNKNVTWSVSPAGIATISNTGLLSALANGTVTVKAVAADGSLTEGTAEVVISGQVSVKDLWGSEFNLIKNWNFDTDMTDWGGWVDGGVAGQVAPVSVDGVAVMKPGLASDGNNWHYQNNQSGLTAEANVPYVLKFKSWASADNTPCAVDFEDKDTNSYNRYGTTTDPESADLKSEWHYNVNVNPEWFTFHVSFDSMVPSTVQKIQWMLSLSNETIYLDSVLLVKEQYLDAEVLPVANAGAEQSVDEGATVTLDGTLSSAPEGEELTYRWVAPAGITLSSTSEANPTFTAPEVHTDKTYTLTLVVSYGSVKPIADQVVVTVKQVDKDPYVKNPIQDVVVDKRAAVKVIDLKTIFADDDLADVISYTVTNSNDEVVTGFVSSDKLTLTFSTLHIGTSEMVVTATSNGKEVISIFNIEVKSPVGINSISDEASLSVYPNPTQGKFELKFSQAPKAGTMITVYNQSGQVILKTVAGDMTVKLDLSGNTAGVYFVKAGDKMFKLVLE